MSMLKPDGTEATPRKTAKDLTDDERLQAAIPSLQRALSTLHPSEIILQMALSSGWDILYDESDPTKPINGIAVGDKGFIDVCAKGIPEKGWVRITKDIPEDAELHPVMTKDPNEN